MDFKNWPDRGHVERIGESLWRPKSRATVMVGAGMSRNARKLANGVREFPLWSDLSRELFQALYPQKLENLGPGEKPWVGIDVMRLGQEYAEVYGRAALDDRLRGLIADEQYEPGDLHRLLLSLPWADVFTTNYDRLLEHTLPAISERIYHVVRTPEGLAAAERPRIVKLHGSFPEHRPFLFTSEDYRTYPEKFAPFVNTVRQAVMESHLCLIGFSGDDPNFLQWIGWVRDQLGGHMRHVYLCGVFDLPEPKRRYFQSLRITPVDLGTLFPEGNWRGQRHEVALDWLLTSLHNCQPVDQKHWPSQNHIQRELITRDEHMPAPLQGITHGEISIPPAPQARLPEDEDDAHHSDMLTAFQIRRQTDPGWVVCPEASRRVLSSLARAWCYGLPMAAAKREAWLRKQPVLQRARALREYVWMLRRCLLPLSDWLDKLITDTLEAFNPNPERIALDTGARGSSRQGATEPGTLITPELAPSEDWHELTEIWVELAFALVNDAWQIQDAERHEQWMDWLQSIVRLDGEWRARYVHAQAWHHLVRLDEAAVRNALKTWPDLPEQPFWQAKHAAMLAEIGELDKAYVLAQSALDRVRRATDSSRGLCEQVTRRMDPSFAYWARTCPVGSGRNTQKCELGHTS